MKIELTLTSGVSLVAWTVFDPTNSDTAGRPVADGTAQKIADAAAQAGAAVREYLKKKAEAATAEAAVWA